MLLPEDVVDPARSRLMSRVRGRNTTPELVVRKILHGLGYRFRLHRKDLPGTPDIVLPGRKAVIFVHGCFWHRHPGCRAASEPKTRQDFWRDKFARNVARDRRDRCLLEEAGWRMMVVWECQTKRASELADMLAAFLGPPRSLGAA